MAINLSSYFQPLWNTTAAIPEQFNLPNCRSLILVKRGSPIVFEEVTPRPIINSVNPRLIRAYEGINSIQFEMDDFQAKISRSYNREQIIGRGISYLIDAQLVDGKPVGGFEADIVPGTSLTERNLFWELLLRRRS